MSGTDNPATIVMDADKNITAEFENSNALLLTISSEKGSVQAFPQEDVYYSGASVILTATPDEGYEFIGWQGDLTGSRNPRGLIMDSNKNIRAVFSLITGINEFVADNEAQIFLMQNYPNPCIVSTNIPYHLKAAAQVRLSIFNIHGVKVATLVDEYQQAGGHSFEWEIQNANGPSLASGIYFYQLEIENYPVQTKTMDINQ